MAEKDHIPRYCTRECQQEIRRYQGGTHSYQCACTAWRVKNDRGPHLQVRALQPGAEWIEVPLAPKPRPVVAKQEVMF